jgi:hypothetical protein
MALRCAQLQSSDLPLVPDIRAGMIMVIMHVARNGAPWVQVTS